MKLSLLAATLLFSIAGPASALNFSFTGNLAGDDDFQLVNFTVGAPSVVTLRTWSYAGGVNDAGEVIPQGGFDPILAIFDSSGGLIGQSDDGTGVPNDAVTGKAYDALVQFPFAPGDYTVSIMQFSNFANGPNLSDGFDGSGTVGFVDSAGDTRSSAWALDVLSVESAVVQGVPSSGSTIAMLGMGVLGLGVFRRLHRRK